jgi:hypothetical protein
VPREPSHVAAEEHHREQRAARDPENAEARRLEFHVQAQQAETHSQRGDRVEPGGEFLGPRDLESDNFNLGPGKRRASRSSTLRAVPADSNGRGGAPYKAAASLAVRESNSPRALMT